MAAGRDEGRVSERGEGVAPSHRALRSFTRSPNLLFAKADAADAAASFNPAALRIGGESRPS